MRGGGTFPFRLPKLALVATSRELNFNSKSLTNSNWNDLNEWTYGRVSPRFELIFSVRFFPCLLIGLLCSFFLAQCTMCFFFCLLFRCLLFGFTWKEKKLPHPFTGWIIKTHVVPPLYRMVDSHEMGHCPVGWYLYILSKGAWESGPLLVKFFVICWLILSKPFTGLLSYIRWLLWLTVTKSEALHFFAHPSFLLWLGPQVHY